MGVKRCTCGPARASKSAWATGLVSRRNLIPDTRDQQTRLDRRRGLARLFSDDNTHIVELYEKVQIGANVYVVP
jgi:hypothetical protein